MSAGLSWFIAVVLAMHGVAHLVGTAGHMRLARYDDIPYTTKLLAGRWDVGDRGAWIVGLLYAFAAAGFVLSAVAWQLDWSLWRALLTGVTAFSLILTLLDWRVAIAGTVIDVGILLTVAIAPSIALILR